MEHQSYHDIAAKLIDVYGTNPSKADEILSSQIFACINKRPFQGICQFIFLTVLRNKFLIDAAILGLSAKKPRKKLLNILRAAVAELLFAPKDKHPKVIDSWVEYAKKSLSLGESKFANAVLRKIPAKLGELRQSGDISTIYSMPKWLVERWLKQFGEKETERILALCLEPSEVFLRKSYSPEAQRLSEQYSEFLEESEFENFFKVKSGNFQKILPLLQARHFYIQDPSTSFAAQKLAPFCGGAYLDLCASPGGKSRLIADLIERDAISKQKSPVELSETLLVSVDTERRIKKLSENMAKADFIKSRVVACDLLEDNLNAKLAALNLPTMFDGVFIDAPCSNTGVLRRRPDARYRISPKDISNCAAIQLQLLEKYSANVNKGGKLVFSTCSIEFDENEANAQEFIKRRGDFRIEFSKTYAPTKQSDGCGVFVFSKC